MSAWSPARTTGASSYSQPRRETAGAICVRSEIASHQHNVSPVGNEGGDWSFIRPLYYQVNTHPPTTLLVHLIVIVPRLTTVDDQGHPVEEKYYKPGTTILLRCLVTNYRPDFPAPMWRREESVVTDSDKTRWEKGGQTGIITV